MYSCTRRLLTAAPARTRARETNNSSIDNSEFTRNGDYTPSRFEAQVDAVSLLFNAKTQSNPENTVGLMSMGGKG